MLRFVLGTINDSASDGTSATFYSAYKSLIDKIKLRCPSAKIVILGIIYRHDETTYENLNGETLPQFRQACIDITSILQFAIY